MDSKNSPVKKQKLPMIDHGIDIIGDEWEDEDDWTSNEINTDALRAEEDWKDEGEDSISKKKKEKNEKI